MASPQRLHPTENRGLQPTLTVKKQTTGMTEDGLPVHSFRSLLADLATMARNTITTAIASRWPLTVLIRSTAVQRRAFDLLDVAV